MVKRIPEETREEIMRLYDDGNGLSPTEIVKRTEMPYSSVYGLTRARQRINPETGQPFESLTKLRGYQARQRINPETGQPFESLTKLMSYRVRQRINPETGQPFESRNQYQEYLARQRINPETGQPFESLNQYQEYLARQRINPETGQPFESRNQYREYQARQRINPETGQPFESRNQYREYQARQRVKRPENQCLSDLIKRRLRELRKDQSWLAKKMGITRQAVSLYANARTVPTKDLVQQLYSALEVPYQTLDDLLEDIDIES